LRLSFLLTQQGDRDDPASGHQFLAPPGVPLTGPLSASYVGGKRCTLVGKSHPLPSDGRCYPRMGLYVAYARLRRRGWPGASILGTTPTEYES
jgi:hypothetical protein